MEGRLQQVVSAIEEMSSRGELSKLLAHLQAQEEVLIQAMPQLDDLLPVLNPATNTIGSSATSSKINGVASTAVATASLVPPG